MTGRAPLALAALMLGIAPSHAQDTAPPKDVSVSVGATLVSDYRYRGLSQTDGDPAVQASFGLDHVSGLYANVWGSTIAPAGRSPLRDGYGHAEVDLSGGYARSIGGATLDAGLRYYAFPDARGGHHGYFEPYASIGYTLGPVAAKLGGDYAWGGQGGLAFAGARDTNLYLFGDASLGVPQTPFTLKAHVGHTAGAFGLLDRTGGDDRYWDWSLGAQAVRGPLRLGVSYVDTDASRGDSRRRSAAVLGSIGVSF